MNGADAAVLAGLFGAVWLAVRILKQNHRQGKNCCGDCAHCTKCGG